MDEKATQELLTAVCKISDAELLEAGAENGWLLALRETMIAVELEHDGAAIRLIGEIGLEASRAEEVLANNELCRGMLRFNGDCHADALWLSLRTNDPAFILTQQLIAEEITETDLTAHLEHFVDFYNAWFDMSESTLANTGGASSTPPPFPESDMLKV